MGSVWPGQRLELLETRGDWRRVPVDAVEGWLHTDHVVISPPAEREASGPAEPTLSDVAAASPLPGTQAPPDQVSSEAGQPTAPQAPAEGVAARLVGDAHAVSQPAAAGLEQRLLAVNLNRRQVSPASQVWLRGDSVLVPRHLLAEWRLRAGQFTIDRTIAGEPHVDLSAVHQLEIWIDEASQELWLEADAGLFEPTTLSLARSRFQAPDRPAAGGFANYEVTGTNLVGSNSLDGDFELGLFGPFGSGSTRLLSRTDELGTRFVRLSSTWTIDLPSRRESVQIGDSQSRAGSWWQSVAIGGITWASDFTTQPGFIPYALPSITGEATLASELELYLGEVLRARERLPVGPFALYDLPVVSGDGTFRVVVRDQLGRETVLTRQFYVSPSLLRAGLREFHYGLGAVREGFGIVSDSYGRPAFVGTERYGVTDDLTLEWHGEILEGHQLLGIGATRRLGRLGVGHLTVAGSRAADTTSRLLQYGLDRQAETFSFGFQVQQAQPDFRVLSVGGSRPAPTRSIRARTSISLGGRGSVSLAYAERELAGAAAFESLSASLGTRLGRKLFLNVSALSTLEPRRNHSVSVNLTRMLGPDRMAAARITSGSGNTGRVGLRYQRSRRRGEGIGYSIATEAGDNERAQASLEYAGSTGTLTLQGVSTNGDGVFRGTWRGSLVGLGGQLMASRLNARSFGLVSTSGFGGVRVYHQNQLIGRSNRRGFVAVPGLLPYQPNKIRIPEEDLPFGARFDDLEKVVSPYARSGLLIEFPIETTRSALLTVLRENGQPLPVGASVRNERTGDEFPVAHDGQVYVTEVADHERFVASWADASCGFELDWPQGVELEARPEPLTCRSQP